MAACRTGIWCMHLHFVQALLWLRCAPGATDVTCTAVRPSRVPATLSCMAPRSSSSPPASASTSQRPHCSQPPRCHHCLPPRVPHSPLRRMGVRVTCRSADDRQNNHDGGGGHHAMQGCFCSIPATSDDMGTAARWRAREAADTAAMAALPSAASTSAVSRRAKGSGSARKHHAITCSATPSATDTSSHGEGALPHAIKTSMMPCCKLTASSCLVWHYWRQCSLQQPAAGRLYPLRSPCPSLHLQMAYRKVGYKEGSRLPLQGSLKVRCRHDTSLMA